MSALGAFRKSPGKERRIQAVRSTARRPRIAIFIVTYNAVGTLRQVLDRIPEEILEKVEEVFVYDDHSADDTYLIGLGCKELHGRAKLSIFRNERNLGSSENGHYGNA